MDQVLLADAADYSDDYSDDDFDFDQPTPSISVVSEEMQVGEAREESASATSSVLSMGTYEPPAPRAASPVEVIKPAFLSALASAPAPALAPEMPLLPTTLIAPALMSYDDELASLMGGPADVTRTETQDTAPLSTLVHNEPNPPAIAHKPFALAPAPTPPSSAYKPRVPAPPPIAPSFSSQASPPKMELRATLPMTKRLLKQKGGKQGS
jgi:hypothetical protein